MGSIESIVSSIRANSCFASSVNRFLFVDRREFVDIHNIKHDLIFKRVRFSAFFVLFMYFSYYRLRALTFHCLQKGYLNMARTMSQSSDESDDDEASDDSDSEVGCLTPNGIKLKPLAEEPVYANMALAANEEKPTVSVRHFRVTNWPDDADFPTDFSTMITLYSEVVECIKKSPGERVLVHCL